MIQLWNRIAGVRTLHDMAEISDIPASSGNVFCICNAEDNGSLSTNRMDFSFGNGNEQNNNQSRGWGLLIPFDGLEVTAITFSCRTATDGNGASVELTKNPDANAAATAQGTGLIVTVPANSYYAFQTGGVVFNAGEILNFITRNPGGSDVVVSAWGRWV